MKIIVFFILLLTKLKLMTLFPDESIVTQSDDKSITLTTHRICEEKNSLQTTGTKSIMLEHITSCESITKQYYFWLVLTVIGILLLANGRNDQLTCAGGFIGIFSIAAFFLSRTAMIKIASPTSAIEFNVKGMDKNSIAGFIDKVEQTKHKRLQSIGNMK